jgi:hypothetical protein
LSGNDLRRLSSARSVAKKKTLIASEQDRPDVIERRVAWRASQELIDPAKVVFIDETWAKTNMTRTYGRSEVGTRLVEKTPCGRWQTTTFLGALRAQAAESRHPQFSNNPGRVCRRLCLIAICWCPCLIRCLCLARGVGLAGRRKRITR